MKSETYGNFPIWKFNKKIQSEFLQFWLEIGKINYILNELNLILKIEIIWMTNLEGGSLQSGRLQLEISFGFPFEFILQVQELEENGK